MRATRLLASPWRALHRNPARIQPATFGTFDGATSSYGVTFAMFAHGQTASGGASMVMAWSVTVWG